MPSLAPRRAIVLAAGRGTRMSEPDPLATLSTSQQTRADAGLKALIPVPRPYIEYGLHALADAGIQHVCIVVSPHGLAAHEQHIASIGPARLTIELAEQAQPTGAATALLAAEQFAQGESVLVVNGDNHYPSAVLAALRTHPPCALPAFDPNALGADAFRRRNYALLDVDEHGVLRDIVEKPDAATFERMRWARVSMNCWHFTPAIFDACRRMQPSERGEFELPNAVRFAIHEMGIRVATFPLAAEVLDLTSRRDVAHVEGQLRGITPRL